MNEHHNRYPGRQFCWIPRLGGDGLLELHLRKEPHHPWKLYTHFPELCVPDYPIPNGSKGWATAQKLAQSGWTIVPTAQARSRWFDNPEAA
jgi:hypothetical protein